MMIRHHQSHHDDPQRQAEHGSHSSRSNHQHCSHSSDPLSRFGLWSQPELLDLLIVQFTVAEATRDGLVQEIGDEMAEIIGTEYSERQRSITSHDVIEIWSWVKQHPQDGPSPYSAWQRACEAFQEGMRGRPHDIAFVPGEETVQNFKNVCARAMVERIRRDRGRDHAERVKQCVIASVEDLGRGTPDQHRSHDGFCAKALVEDDIPADSTSSGGDRVGGASLSEGRGLGARSGGSDRDDEATSPVRERYGYSDSDEDDYGRWGARGYGQYGNSHERDGGVSRY